MKYFFFRSIRFMKLDKLYRLISKHLDLFVISLVCIITYQYFNQWNNIPGPKLSNQKARAMYQKLSNLPKEYCQTSVIPARVSKKGKDLKSITDLELKTDRVIWYGDREFPSWNAEVCFEKITKLDPKNNWFKESEKFTGFTLYNISFNATKKDIERLQAENKEYIYIGRVQENTAMFINQELVYKNNDTLKANKLLLSYKKLLPGINHLSFLVYSRRNSGSGLFNAQPIFIGKEDNVDKYVTGSNKLFKSSGLNETYRNICLFLIYLLFISLLYTTDKEAVQGLLLLLLSYWLYYLFTSKSFSTEWTVRKRTEITVTILQTFSFAVVITLSFYKRILAYSQIRPIAKFIKNLNFKTGRTLIPALYFIVGLAGTFFATSLTTIYSIQATGLHSVRFIFNSTLITLSILAIASLFAKRKGSPDGNETINKLNTVIFTSAITLFLIILVFKTLHLKTLIMNLVYSIPNHNIIDFIELLIASFRRGFPSLVFYIILAIVLSHYYSFNKLFSHVSKQMTLISKNVVRMTGRSAIKNEAGFSQGVVRFICKYDIRDSTDNLKEMMLLVQKIYFNLFGNLLGKSLTGDISPRFQGDGILSLKEVNEDAPYLGLRKFIILKQLLIMSWLLGEGKKQFSTRFLMALEMSKIILPRFSTSIDRYLLKMREKIIATKAIWVFKIGVVEEQVIGKSVKMHEFYSEDINFIARLESVTKEYGKKHTISMEDIIVFDEETMHLIKHSLGEFGFDKVINRAEITIRNFEEEEAFYYIRREDIEALVCEHHEFSAILNDVKPIPASIDNIGKFSQILHELETATTKRQIVRNLRTLSVFSLNGFEEKDLALNLLLETIKKNPLIGDLSPTGVTELFNHIGYPGVDIIKYTKSVLSRETENLHYQKAIDITHGDFYAKIEAAKFVTVPKLQEKSRFSIIKAIFSNFFREEYLKVKISHLEDIYEFINDDRIEKTGEMFDLIKTNCLKIINFHGGVLERELYICFLGFLTLSNISDLLGESVNLNEFQEKILAITLDDIKSQKDELGNLRVALLRAEIEKLSQLLDEEKPVSIVNKNAA